MSGNEHNGSLDAIAHGNAFALSFNAHAFNLPVGDMGWEMDGHSKKAFDYRQRAEELRAMIQDFKDPKTREIFERIAATYEHLANLQDGMAITDKTLRRGE